MKLSPSWWAFLLLEWTAEEEKSSTILLSYETNNLHNEQDNVSRPIFWFHLSSNPKEETHAMDSDLAKNSW